MPRIGGVLIAESLRVDATLEGVPLTITRISRSKPKNISAEQRRAGLPETWTVIWFEAPVTEAGRLAEAVAQVIDGPGWYCDFHSPEESFVVFPGRIFRYRRGDKASRAEAEAYARSLSVPEAQLGCWPD